MMVAVHPALKLLQLSPLESYVFCSERLNPVDEASTNSRFDVTFKWYLLGTKPVDEGVSGRWIFR